MTWSRPPDLLGRPTNPRETRLRSAIENAEQLRQADPARAVDLLVPYRDELPEFGRLLLTEAAISAGRDQVAVELLSPPNSAGEFVQLVEILIRKHLFDDAQGVLDADGLRLEVNPAQVAELKARLAAYRAMKR